MPITLHSPFATFGMALGQPSGHFETDKLYRCQDTLIFYFNKFIKIKKPDYISELKKNTGQVNTVAVK
jgi:hypothetical protein